MASTDTENLLTQTEARAEARRLNDEGDNPPGMVSIAGTVPPNAWGGAERGWTVYCVSAAGLA